jgi:pyrimidine-nucleoside phosphorylase
VRAVDLIQKKRDGGALADAEIRHVIAEFTAGSLPDYQAAALLMAIFFRGMDARELATWADAMLHSGVVLDLSSVSGIKVDKHSTGGVSDSVSLALAPIVAACGVPVPMISGRGLGHTGGTLDKLESIPGFRTDLDVDAFRSQVERLGCALIGQTAEIAPADKRMYALRDVTATVECIPLIASSILSKKLAEGIDALLLDVKVGSGAFLRDPADARRLAETMLGIGKAAGKDVVALLTDMDAPLGTYVGNALEVREIAAILRNDLRAGRLRELTLVQAAHMLVLGGVAPTLEAARSRAEAVLGAGEALRRMEAITAAQGGDPRALTDDALLPLAPVQAEVRAPRSGMVARFVCAEVGRAAMLLGAGRAQASDRVDPGAGIVLHVERGDRVEAGAPLATLYTSDASRLPDAERVLADAIVIGDSAPPLPPLVHAVLRAP